METLLSEIETFCSARSMSPSRFGELAMSDKGFVFGLQKGRRVWPETAERVRNFIAAYREEAA